MSKDSVLKRLNKEWNLLLQSFSDLSDDDLIQPDVTGKWSVRDILAHITTWDVEALKNLPLILNKQKTPLYSTTFGGIDAYNRQEQERKCNLTLPQIKQQLDEGHQRLLIFLGNAPEQAFLSGTRFQRRLREDTYAHYPEHFKAINFWKERLKKV
jgi:uncharacterized damage-inducible protein DinB